MTAALPATLAATLLPTLPFTSLAPAALSVVLWPLPSLAATLPLTATLLAALTATLLRNFASYAAALAGYTTASVAGDELEVVCATAGRPVGEREHLGRARDIEVLKVRERDHDDPACLGHGRDLAASAHWPQ